MEKKKGEKVEYVGYTSSRLRFSISIPSDWRVHTDRLEVEPGPSQEEVYEVFRQTFPDSTMSLEDFKKAGKPPTAEEAYEELSEEEKTLVRFPEFKEQYEWEQEQEREKERKRAELIQIEGYFGASSSTDKDDYPSVEVTRLKLTRPMTPLELYQLDKPGPDPIAVPWGNRPSKGVIVDGLQGVKYYYIFNTGETRYTAEMPKFFNVYLAEGQIGWIISCSCIARAFSKYKSIFTTIVDSFRRI